MTADIAMPPPGGGQDPDRFDPDYYLRANEDVRTSGFDPHDHFVRFGKAEGRAPNAYQAARRLSRAAGPSRTPTTEAAVAADRETVDPTPDDPTLASRPAVALAGDPARSGSKIDDALFALGDDQAGDDPAPPGWFDADWYRQQNRDVRTFDLDPYRHYLDYGAREGRAPNRVIAKIEGLGVSPRNRSPRQQAAVMATIAESGLFDAAWYGERYGVDPGHAIAHYVAAGAYLGNDPSPFFSSLDYLKANRDAAKDGRNPLAHYVEFGFLEGRRGVRSLADTRLTTRIWLKGL